MRVDGKANLTSATPQETRGRGAVVSPVGRQLGRLSSRGTVTRGGGGDAGRLRDRSALGEGARARANAGDGTKVDAGVAGSGDSLTSLRSLEGRDRFARRSRGGGPSEDAGGGEPMEDPRANGAAPGESPMSALTPGGAEGEALAQASVPSPAESAPAMVESAVRGSAPRELSSCAPAQVDASSSWGASLRSSFSSEIILENGLKMRVWSRGEGTTFQVLGRPRVSGSSLEGLSERLAPLGARVSWSGRLSRGNDDEEVGDE